MQENFIKSPLNYTGGKYKLLSQLIPLFPKNGGKFVDLFTGGGNVVANISGFDKRIANDLDKKVIEIFKQFQRIGLDKVIREIKTMIERYDLDKQNAEAYFQFREWYNNSLLASPIDLFILICFSFNNQIRFNKKGEFNLPFGKRCYNERTEKNLTDFINAIDDVEFISEDFRCVFDEIELNKGDFVYCDPPYLISCATYNERNGWNETDEKDLLKLLDELNEKGVYFGLSNVLTSKGKRNDILSEWCKNYVVHHLNNSYSHCSYNTKDRESKPDEVYITNFLC